MSEERGGQFEMAARTVQLTEGREGLTSAADAARPVVSVIIPALNEERTIAACLDALCKMECASGEFEVILVDNGSSDRTIEVAQRYCDRLPLKVLTRAGVHISAVRNFGTKHAKGEILAFLDADCVPSSAWVRNVISRIEKTDGAAIIGSHYRIPASSRWVAEAWYGDIEARKTGTISYVPAGDLIVKRDLFLSLGGFDESIQTNEDSELCHRAREHGHSTIAFRDLAVEHLGTPQTVASFYKKQRWHGTHVFRVFLRKRGLQNIKPVALAVYTMVALLGIVAGLALAITGKTFMVLAVSSGAFLLPGIVLSVASWRERNSVRRGMQAGVLSLVYGMARGRCLLDVRSWLMK